MRRLAVSIPIAAALFVSACATHPGKVNAVRFAADRKDVLTRIEAGWVRGMAGAGVRAHLGLPYAAPPVGELRWRSPRPVQPWSGVRDATRAGSDCTQAIGRRAVLGGGGGIPIGREDCLFVNVYAPADAEGPLPVMVYIHGGAFTIGSGINYDPSRLAREQRRVVVTFNYRLGALGWLAHPDFAEDGEGTGGNWGLMDARAALTWVQDNIHAFGGDTEDVTLFAESAGAWMACHLMANPEHAGLWTRVILQSGACVEPTALWSADEVVAGGPAFAASVGCDDPDAVACLRQVPARRLSRAASTRQGLNGPGSWGPIYGDALVPEVPPAAFAAGRFVRTPVMIGTNADEGRLFATEVRDRDRYDKETVWMYGEHGPAVLERYPVDGEAYGLTMAESFTAQKFACPAHALRDLLARHVSVHGYEFADPRAPIIVPRWLLPYDLGAYHASELTYVFGTRWAFADPGRFDPDQRALSDRMMTAWATFGRDGFAPDWSPATTRGGPVRRLSPDGDWMDAEFAERHQCDFWASIPFGPAVPGSGVLR